jgi:hypothetical protein
MPANARRLPEPTFELSPKIEGLTGQRHPLSGRFSMVRQLIFYSLLFGSCGFALLKGTRDTQIVAVTTLAATFVSLVLVSRYAGVEFGVLVVDILVLFAFAAVALKSDRFWPLWIAGLQLTTSFGHMLRAWEDQMVPIAYAVALRSWSYPIQIILIVAVWRGLRRKQQDMVPVASDKLAVAPRQ